jgi:hypothetical protein
MRIFALVFLLLISSMTFASTVIHTIIKKDQHFVASWWEKFLRLNNDFPQKQYETKEIRVANPNYIGIKDHKSTDIKNSEKIFITLKLNLISYDKASASYKFNLSISEVRLQQKGKYKNVAANVYFDNSHNQNMTLLGKFKPVPKGTFEMPQIDEASKDDFILSVDEMKDITISTQHNIPITIKLHN